MRYFLGIALFFFSIAVLAKDVDALVSSEVGYRYRYTELSKDTQKRPYLQSHLTKKFGDNYTDPIIDVSFRASQAGSETNTEAELRSFLITKRGKNYSFEWGLQTVSWSETFGFNIIDLVNPRDWSEYVFDDLAWAQLPVWALKNTFSFGSFKIQPLYVPRARNNILPRASSYFDPLPEVLSSYSRREAKKKEFFDSSEGGLRLEYLFDFGLDLSLVAYSHYNRLPSYSLEEGTLVLADKRLTSYAASFTYSEGGLVLRGDTLKTLAQPYFSTDLQYSEKDQLQGIYGADYTFSNQFVLGAQYQFSNIHNESWWALQAKKTVEDFELQCLYFQGITNADKWFRPEVTWRLPSSISLRFFADFISGKENEGNFGTFIKKKQYVTNLSWLF